MKILFLDRDGTLIHEPRDGYIDSLKKLQILPGVVEALQKFTSKGYQLTMISNQPGLGTDRFPKDNFETPQNELISIFTQKNVHFAGTFFCPHFREDNCNCMKPQTGLIEAFLNKHSPSLEHSYVIGDRESDIVLAKNIGCKSIYYSDKVHPQSDFNSKNWNLIVDYILQEN